MKSEQYVSGAEVAIGILLCVCCVAGLLFNVTSCIYFFKNSGKNKNACYFQRIYQVISLLDFLVCLTLFPFIDAAFSKDRQGALLTTTSVCEVWTMLWKVLPEMTTFMVAFVSVSRLLLLISPQKIFQPILGWLVPVVYCICSASFKCILRVLGITKAHYLTIIMFCDYINDFGENAAPDYIPTSQEWGWDICLKALTCIQIGMTVIPITLSCGLSVIYLYKSNQIVNSSTSRKKGSPSRQNAATVTVIIFTFVYIIFNIPVLGFYIYLTKWTSNVERGNMTLRDILISQQVYFNTTFLRLYIVPLFGVCFNSLNSVVNPVVYYIRMMPFKNFVDEKIFCKEKRKSSVISNTNNITMTDESELNVTTTAEL